MQAWYARNGLRSRVKVAEMSETAEAPVMLMAALSRSVRAMWPDCNAVSPRGRSGKDCRSCKMRVRDVLIYC